MDFAYIALMQTTYGKPQAGAAHPPRGLAPLNHPPGQDDESLLAALMESKVYREYEHAFIETTGMPMALRPVEAWQLPLHGKRYEAPYCALMSQQSRACSSCLQTQERLSRAATQEPHTVVCPAGLCETAVPVRLGDRVIGYLQTGQVFRQPPTKAQFERLAKMVEQWGTSVDREKMKAAYFATRVVSARQQESAATLLKIFAQHLSTLTNQVVVQREHAETPVITKAKQYIEEHQTEDLRLAEVAKAVNTSTFYFCKMFRKVTGVNFTDYVSRVRIEKSKNLLLNPNLRVSEIAYEVGFQSLTHFNRVFKRLLGQSPTEYREQLMMTGKG
jgi:AraC-like DNA-binding protein